MGRFHADASSLYFAIQVWDDQVMTDSPEVWHDDEVELALDAWHDHRMGADDHQYTVNPDDRVTDRTVPVALDVGYHVAAPGYTITPTTGWITGVVFVDWNRDGVPNPGEPPLPDVIITTLCRQTR